MKKHSIYNFAGFLGGIIRRLVGFVKNKTLEKANHFKLQYLLITILISGIVGAAAGVLADTEWRLSFLAGYAGTDFIEDLYKMRVKFFCFEIIHAEIGSETKKRRNIINRKRRFKA